MGDGRSNTSYFDERAATWDSEPRRIELMKAVGAAIVREACPQPETELLDYGCGTGLIGLYLLPYVRSVTAADNSPGMLDVVRRKISEAGIGNMRLLQLDLQHDPLPPDRYDLVVTSMTMHHVQDLDSTVRGLWGLLRSGGTLCMADLDSEPGIFHPPEAAGSVYHHGFDRAEMAARLERAGFFGPRATTAHIVQRPIATGEVREFPVFLLTARKD